MSRAVPAAAPGLRRPAPLPSGRGLHLLRQLLLLLCAVAAIAVFALTLMLPGMYSPHRAPAKAAAVPQVMLVPSSRARESSRMLVWCQTRQAVFIC